MCTYRLLLGYQANSNLKKCIYKKYVCVCVFCLCRSGSLFPWVEIGDLDHTDLVWDIERS